MKALTIYQPYASLIAIGRKRYETRSWATNYRGPIAIHAGLKLPSETLLCKNTWYRKDIWEALGRDSLDFTGSGIRSIDDLPLGAIIATAELVGCYDIHVNPLDKKMVSIFTGKSPAVSVSEWDRCFGDWTSGRYAWELANVKLLDEPIPARGRHGLWNLEAPE